MTKSKEYWNKRFEQLENAQMNKGAAYYAELEKQYRKASSAIQSDIEKWYARFATNNEISLQEAKKLLTSNELEEFKWSVMEYVEKGRTLKVSNQWAKQLENASAKVHVTRLEAIKLQMQNHIEMLYGNEQDDLANLLEKIYTEGYYHTAYEIQKGFNVGYDLMKLDTNKVEKLIAKPWAADGSNFSDRIWKQKSQLVSELHNNLTQAIIRGRNPKVVTDEIAKRFNVSKGQAGRLVMTESAFFASASNRDCYKDLGVEQYEILATLDTRTSELCQGLDGKVFKMSEYEVGVTAPPFHAWCRTTTVPYFDDEFTLDETRAARNAENGERYYVPANMKYDTWHKAFVEGNHSDYHNAIVNKIKQLKLANELDSATIKVTNKGSLFEKVKTNKEANDFATRVLGIPNASFDGIPDVEITNEWLFGLYDNFDRFPELRNQFKFVGNVHERNRLYEIDLRKWVTSEYQKLNPTQSMKTLQPHIDDYVDKAMKKVEVTKSNMAQSFSANSGVGTNYVGICVNGDFTNTFDEWIKSLEEDVNSKFHPVGCDTIRSVLDHEIGHQLDNMLGIRNVDEIKELFDSRTTTELTEAISRYSWKNSNNNKYAEMIAEAWSEYCNNKEPRDIAKKVGETIEEYYKHKFGGTP